MTGVVELYGIAVDIDFARSDSAVNDRSSAPPGSTCNYTRARVPISRIQNVTSLAGSQTWLTITCTMPICSTIASSCASSSGLLAPIRPITWIRSNSVIWQVSDTVAKSGPATATRFSEVSDEGEQPRYAARENRPNDGNADRKFAPRLKDVNQHH